MDEDDNGKFRLERVKKTVVFVQCIGLLCPYLETKQILENAYKQYRLNSSKCMMTPYIVPSRRLQNVHANTKSGNVCSGFISVLISF